MELLMLTSPGSHSFPLARGVTTTREPRESLLRVQYHLQIRHQGSVANTSFRQKKYNDGTRMACKADKLLYTLVIITCPSNLVPRLSLHWLPLSLGERPRLRLVTWPPRIWLVNKSVGWEGWQSISMMKVSKPRAVSKIYPLYQCFEPSPK